MTAIQAEEASFPAGVARVEYTNGRTVLSNGWQYFADLDGVTVSNPAEALDLGIYPESILISATYLPKKSIDFSWEDAGQVESDSISLIDPALEEQARQALKSWAQETVSAITPVPSNARWIEYVGESRGDLVVVMDENWEYFANPEGTELVFDEYEAYNIGTVPTDSNVVNATYDVAENSVNGGYSAAGVSFSVSVENAV